MEKEKQQSIKKVVGVSKDTETLALSELKEKFKNQPAFNYEKEKTPEIIEIISLVNQATNDVMQKYGWENINIPPDNVHIIDYKKWEDAYGDARYLNLDQAIAIQEQPYKVLFARKLFHEMIHFKSYNAAQAVNEEETTYPEDYRKGLVILSRDGKNIYLNNLNEAIVEEITKMNINNLLKNPVFDNEMNNYNKIKTANINMKSYSGLALFDDETYFAEIMNKKPKWLKIILPNLKREEGIHAIQFTYKEERSILHTLINKLEHRQSNHTNTDEIFEIFAKAAITGSILPMARIIENTFGHGTLRHIAELDDSIDEQKKFVESL